MQIDPELQMGQREGERAESDGKGNKRRLRDETTEQLGEGHVRAGGEGKGGNAVRWISRG